MDEQLIELETKIAFQEDLIQKLSEAVNRHEKELYQVRRELKTMRDQLSQQADSHLADIKDEPPPPHY